MSTTAKNLIESKYAEDAQTTQYTATGVRTVIDKFTATNISAATALLSVNIVPNGGSAGNSNLIVKQRQIAAGETFTFPGLVGQVLASGDFISTLAGTASALVIRASGREMS